MGGDRDANLPRELHERGGGDVGVEETLEAPACVLAQKDDGSSDDEDPVMHAAANYQSAAGNEPHLLETYLQEETEGLT